MMTRPRLLVLLAALAVSLSARIAYAAPADYVFEPVSVDVRNGKDSEFAVRLRQQGDRQTG